MQLLMSEYMDYAIQEVEEEEEEIASNLDANIGGSFLKIQDTTIVSTQRKTQLRHVSSMLKNTDSQHLLASSGEENS